MLRQKEHATGIRIALLLACGRLVAQYFSVYHCVRCARHLSQASASAWRCMEAWRWSEVCVASAKSAMRWNRSMGVFVSWILAGSRSLTSTIASHQLFSFLQLQSLMHHLTSKLGRDLSSLSSPVLKNLWCLEQCIFTKQ